MKIIRTDNWGHFEYIYNRIEVLPGYYVTMAFPDETVIGPVKVNARRTRNFVSDHGHDSIVYTKVLFVDLPFHGTTVSIELDALFDVVRVQKLVVDDTATA